MTYYVNLLSWIIVVVAVRGESLSSSSSSSEYESVLNELKEYWKIQQESRTEHLKSLEILDQISTQARKMTDRQKKLQARSTQLKQKVLLYNSKQVSSLSLPKLTPPAQVENGNDSELNRNEPPITKEELASGLTWHSIGGDASEQRLLRHFKQILMAEYEDYHNDALLQIEAHKQEQYDAAKEKEEEEDLDAELAQLKQNMTSMSSSLTSTSTSSMETSSNTSRCIELPEAAQVIAQQLWDHATFKRQQQNLLWNSSIVHSMTSDSFVKSTWEWLQPYIPEDWERIIQPNYQKIMPSYLPFQSSSPKTVLSSNTHVGSCWPMQGSSGQITFVFATPPSSIDKLIISHTSYTENLSSAPHTISLIGYPPCTSEECFHLSFDSTQPIALLSHVEFQIEIEPFLSTQIFPIPSFTQTKTTTNQPQQSLPPQGSSCTVDPNTFEPQSSASCSGGHDDNNDEESNIQALSIVIHDNWGHPDYTCLYNIVIQGQQ